MRPTVLIAGLFICVFCWSGQLSAQGRYMVVGATENSAVMITPTDRRISIGDKFYIIRASGTREVAIAIAEVDRFQGKYCRVRIVKPILNKPPQQGDYLVEYSSKIPPSTQTPEPQRFEEPPAPREAEPYRSGPRFLVGIFTGLGFSNFSGNEIYAGAYNLSQSGYLPVGGQALLGIFPVEVGAEASYALAPFRFEREDDDSGELLWEDQLDQLYLGALVRVNFLKGPAKLFLRGGAGVFLGDFTRSYSQSYKTRLANQLGIQLQDQEISMDSSPGFNLGAGFGFRGGYVEFVYHFVDRKREVSLPGSNGQLQTETLGIDGSNGAAQVGFLLSF